MRCFESPSPQPTHNPSPRPNPSSPPTFLIIFTLSHNAHSCNSRGTQIHTPDFEPKLPACLTGEQIRRPLLSGAASVWPGKQARSVHCKPTHRSKQRRRAHIADGPEPSQASKGRFLRQRWPWAEGLRHYQQSPPLALGARGRALLAQRRAPGLLSR